MGKRRGGKVTDGLGEGRRSNNAVKSIFILVEIELNLIVFTNFLLN